MSNLDFHFGNINKLDEIKIWTLRIALMISLHHFYTYEFFLVTEYFQF